MLWGAYRLREYLAALMSGRRAHIILHTVGLLGILLALTYFSVRYPLRADLTEAGHYSLSAQTVQMLERLDKPVRITFFHDPLMRETVELYQQIASKSKHIELDLYDPMLNPAQARMRGVEFAGTAIMESEGRNLQVHGASETDIANGILRVSQGIQQLVCFLDGHGEPDPFSLESHDHLEGTAGHSHGLGAKIVVHERHGMARARNALETMNFAVEKRTLLQGSTSISECAVLVVAGPKTSLLPPEVATIRTFLQEGGNALFMFDPFVKSGLEPVLRELGVVADENIVIDPASHFWADPSSPAVTDYNRHQVTRELPLTFFPGARSLSPTDQRAPGVAAIPLVNTSKQSFGETSPDSAEFTEGKDTRGPLTLMVILNRRPATAATEELLGGGSGAAERASEQANAGEKRSRIAIIGDSDFATNSFFHILGNGTLFLNTVSYLASQENLIGLEPRSYDPPRVNLTNRQMKGVFVLSVILIPALLGLIGTAVWWRQR